jgi:hypothetical protein
VIPREGVERKILIGSFVTFDDAGQGRRRVSALGHLKVNRGGGR